YLERTNRGRSVTIKSQVVGRPGGSVGRSFSNAIEQMDLKEGLTLIYGGATKRTREGLTSMIGAFVISIFLVYLILAALYNSFYYPLVVLFSIPLAVIGAFLALALTGQALSVFSIMGLIMLAGLVGKNAILVVDFTNTLREQGMAVRDALLEATKLRFRPILMTNLTMVIGLLPIALSTGAGSEWKNGLAWALIGGLSSSMLLTLVVVPLVYDSLERFRSKVGLDKRP
ncbi:MAG: efflux RND transporter permease subunit, partial [Bacteroidota bacterium]